jgi:hypothetical protein
MAERLKDVTESKAHVYMCNSQEHKTKGYQGYIPPGINFKR